MPAAATGPSGVAYARPRETPGYEVNRFQSGSVLGERYSLQTRIASGGMGDVWEATDGVLERQVAVKILRPSLDEEEVFARRFRNEALHTANLCHYNIATVFDYGEEDDLAR